VKKVIPVVLLRNEEGGKKCCNGRKPKENVWRRKGKGKAFVTNLMCYPRIYLLGQMK
jgi:hypothetical protein